MSTIAAICEADTGLFLATPYRILDVESEEEVKEAIFWWEVLTAKGSEGMVVKPFEFVAHGKKGLVQPAIKCRGREYLRIIYDPEYTAHDNLARLKNKGLSRKDS